MKKIFLVSCFLSLVSFGANANWESATSSNGGLNDDGARVTIALRGGLAYANAKIKNDLGSLVPEPYWYSLDIGVMTESYCGGAAECAALGFTNVGQINIADLPAAKKFNNMSWAAGAGLGWTMGGHPQWRFEGSWDHIAQTDYNASPMFKGSPITTLGYQLPPVESAGVQSTATTDIFSAMVYYDFFDGMTKPLNEFIPYIGLGLGYADSRTTLNLIDLYGELSGQDDLQDFGTDTGGAALRFFTSNTSTSNVAATGALGFSYGIGDNTFIDAGLRLIWIPKIQWALNNDADSNATIHKSRDIFSAHNVIYGTAMIGIRFEF